MEPRAGAFERAVAHVDANPRYWDMTLTNHTPQQTGINCFFKDLGVRRPLSCEVWYDISNRYHVRGAQHWKQCLRWQVGDTGVCDEIATHIENECSWPKARAGVRAIHLKGSTKPWRNIPGQCAAIKDGAIAARLAGGRVERVLAVDQLEWQHGQCFSHDLQAPVHFAATGEKLPVRCCSFVNLVKAEWWWIYRRDNERAKGV
jgi:hypothetical protein